MITIWFYIKGGHINPAVTLTQAFMKKFPWKKVWYFIFAQYLGAFLASGVVYLTYYECIAHFDHGLRSAFGNNTSTGHIFATYPAPHVTILGSFIDQVIIHLIIHLIIYLIIHLIIHLSAEIF